jgi:hypothetical protein
LLFLISEIKGEKNRRSQVFRSPKRLFLIDKELLWSFGVYFAAKSLPDSFGVGETGVDGLFLTFIRFPGKVERLIRELERALRVNGL